MAYSVKLKKGRYKIALCNKTDSLCYGVVTPFVLSSLNGFD